MRYDGGCFVSSDAQPVPTVTLTQGTSNLLEMHQDEDERPKKSADETNYHEQLIHEFPWLAHLDITEAFGPQGETAAKKLRASASSERDDEPPSDELVWEAIADMEKARAAHVVDEPHEDMEFSCKVRGGTRHFARTGKANDALQASNNSDRGNTFCEGFHMSRTFKATFSEHGEDASRVLCRAWAHRMQHFFELAQRAPDPATFEFTAGEVAEYCEPTELTRLAETCARSTRERVNLIREIPRPTLGRR